MTEGTKANLSTGVLAFLAGAAAGAIAALLLTPLTGSESRSRLEKAARRTRELAGRIPTAVQDATATIRSAIQREKAALETPAAPLALGSDVAEPGPERATQRA